MAEEEKKDTPEETTPPVPHRNKRAMLVGAGILGLLLIVGIPAVLLFSGDEPAEVALETPEMEPESRGKPEGFEEEEELEEGEEPLGAIVPFETFLVNLSGGKYIRAQVQVEFETLDIPRRFYSRQVPIRDSIISLLTKSTAESLETEKGKEKLRSEIRSIVNTALRKEEVRKVYFTQFVIQ